MQAGAQLLPRGCCLLRLWTLDEFSIANMLAGWLF